MEQGNSVRQPNQALIPPNPSRPKLQQEGATHIPSKLRHRENQANPIRIKHPEHENRANPNRARETGHEGQADPSSARWLDQAYQADPAKTNRIDHDELNPGRIKRIEQVDEPKYTGVKRTEQVDEANHCRLKQIDQAESSRIKRTEPVDQANPRHPKQSEQVDESNHSRVKWPELVDQAHSSRINQTEQVDPSPSRAKRLEAWQLDEEAIPKRPQRHQEQQDGQYLGSHPKRLRTLQQSQQEQTNQGLGSPKVQQHRLLQISSQQQTAKKLTQIPVQGAHGLHQSPKIPSLPVQTSSPHPLLPSTSASLQSSAPSLSTSALSDEAQKPSKKRKLRSLLEPEVIHGHSVADHGIDEQPHTTSLTPVTTPADNSPVVKPHYKSRDSKERAAASSSPKTVFHGPQLVPAKKLLKGILDRLQKKDKFGVFAEPVDKNEVPNYYDIIKDPMDFGTMRNRISSGHYISIDLFQKDIFLICDNAMNYNGKGTVYFRHARSIKDIAERILEDLKVSGLSMEMDEPMTKQKNGASGRLTEKYDSSMNAGSPSETRADNVDDFSGYLLRTAGLFDGRRFNAIDENRRGTYMPISTPFQSNDPLLTTISGDPSHFVPTGYQMEFPYAKSLARFAADLGPSVWKVAAEKIRRALPPGFPFGPGWVGERETPGGIVMAPSTKQQPQGQPSVQPTPKLQNDNGAVAVTTNGNPPAILPKLDDQLHLQAGHSQESNGAVSKLDHHTGMQPRLQVAAKPPNEIRSPMVFGNSLVHNERPNRLDQQALVQPAVDRLHNSENSRTPLQVGSPVNQESMVKLDQVSGGAGSKSKFANQVNLNHPLSYQPEEGVTIDDRVLNMDSVMKGKEDRESKVNAFLPGPVPSSGVVPATNAGCLPFEGNPIKGGAYTSRAPQLDRVNSMKATNGEAGLAARNQFDGRPLTNLSRINSLNESPIEEASSTNGGKSNAFNHHDNFHSLRGSLLPHNLNLPAQQPSGNSRVATQDANLGESMRPNSSTSHSTQGLALPRNMNMLVQQSSSNSHQTISSNHVRSRDASPVEPGLPRHAPPCPEKAVGERFREAGDFREKEVPSSTPIGMMPKKGFVPERALPERAFMMQQLESRNGQGSSHDLNNQNLDQMNRRQNASVGLSASGFPPGLPTSNGAFRVREESRLPGWVPAQQPDSTPVSGKGGIKMHNQIMRSPAEQHEVTPGNVSKPQNMRLASLQLQGVQNPQVYGYGNQKHVSNVPHFLQQQLGHDTHLPIQHQQMQLHLQSSSMKPGDQNSGPSESRDPKFARQFQVPSHRVAGFTQAGNPGWQSMPPQMVSQGPHQPFAAAPDLNVSLPLTKSPFDQPNGNDIQQPDLALQL